MASGPHGSAGQENRKRVLVVDGESAICGFVTSVMADVGYGVACASTGEEAVRIARQDNILCGLVEVMLPDGWGDDVAEELTQLGVPVTLTSGHPEGMARGKASRHPFLQKPFGVQDLLRAVVDQTLIEAVKLR